MKSIRGHLLAWVLGTLTVGALLLLAASYRVTLEELNEVFDENLKQVALSVAVHHAFDVEYAPRTRAQLQPLPQRYHVPLPETLRPAADFDYVTLVWSRDGQRRFASDPAARVPFTNRDGIARVDAGGEAWHVYTITGPWGSVQAAQRARARRLLAVETTIQMLVPAGLVILLTAGLLVFALRRGLRPLDVAAERVAARSPHSLAPISKASLPREIDPLVASINGLMRRLEEALLAQRRFVADAAHELRTPITALKLQLQLLGRSRDEVDRAEHLARLRAGIDRSQQLVEQLLQLSRVGAEAPATFRDDVDLGALVREVVGDLSLEAEHRRIDLGAHAPQAPVVRGDRDQLRVMLGNLVQNAIRHSPPGSVVDVHAGQAFDGPYLAVVDDGPGIAPEERERVFDRFYRAEARGEADAVGTGLGLAIVRAIAQRHDAQVSLQTPASGKGLEARVRFGRAA